MRKLLRLRDPPGSGKVYPCCLWLPRGWLGADEPAACPLLSDMAEWFADVRPRRADSYPVRCLDPRRWLRVVVVDSSPRKSSCHLLPMRAG